MFFPSRDDMLSEYTGSGAGKGYTVNVAWHTPYRDDKTTDLGCNEYRLAWEEVLGPIAREFAPDIIMISCGFVSAIHDPLGKSKLCPLGYYYMT